MVMSGVQEGLELPEDEEEKKKTEADKEKFGGLCKVLLMASLLLNYKDFAWNIYFTGVFIMKHLVVAGDEVPPVVAVQFILLPRLGD